MGIFSIALITFSRMEISLIENFPPGLEKLMRAISAGIGGFLAARLAYLLIRRQLKKYLGHEVPLEQYILLSTLLRFGIFIIPVLMVLNQFGLSLNNITLILGLLTTGLAFAIRDILVSLLAWLMILIRQPFRLGHVICIGEDTGKVVSIDTFFVTLNLDLRSDGNLVRIPNRLFLEKPVLLHPENQIRDEIHWPLSEGNTDTDMIIQHLRDKSVLLPENQALADIETRENAPHIWVTLKYRVDVETRHTLKNRIMRELSIILPVKDLY